MEFIPSPAWKLAYPGAMIGVLAMDGVANPPKHPDLQARKVDLEARLRQRYGPLDKTELRSHPILKAYAAYYKGFGKTYHVQLQIESVIYKGKSIPSVAGLVEAMFVAELEDMLLTAGHDLDEVQGDLAVGVAAGTEEYVLINNQPQRLKKDDMYIRDDAGVLSSIIYGPAARARITPATHRALFTVYAPAGIGRESLSAHLARLRELVCIVAPRAQVVHEGVVGEGPAG